MSREINIPLSLLSDRARQVLEVWDQDPFIDGPADGVFSNTELDEVLSQADRIPEGDPRREVLLQAKAVMQSGDLAKAEGFFKDVASISLADVAKIDPQMTPFADTLDKSLGIPSSNSNDAVDRGEVIDAMQDTAELSPVQRGYLTLMGGIMGVDDPQNTAEVALKILAEVAPNHAKRALPNVVKAAAEAGVPMADAARGWVRAFTDERRSTSSADKVFGRFGEDLARHAGESERYQAYRAIREVEDDSYDSLKGFTLAEKAAAKAGSTIMNAAQLMVRVLKDERGSSGSARNVFEKFGDEILSQGGESERYDAYRVIRKSEDDSYDSLKGFGLAEKAARSTGATIMDAAAVMVRILKDERGSSGSARNVFEKFGGELLVQEGESERYDAYRAIRQAEDDSYDSLKGFALAEKAAAAAEASIMEAAEAMVRVLKDERGSSGSARNVYAKFGVELLSGGAAMAYQAYRVIRQAEDDSYDSLRDFALIEAAIAKVPEATLGMGAEIFRAMLVGHNGSTSEAQKQFREQGEAKLRESLSIPAA